MSAAPSSTVTAALLVIGDEILSGRTKDKNIGTVAEFCTGLGVELKEVRVVSDEMDAIIEAVNALRGRYTHVFTTGGIGPTHDDITADAVARAFGVELPVDADARRALETHYRTADVSPERLRMARVPVGGRLIRNIVSGAPGFSIGNVHVMAGVPVIMEAMLEDLATRIAGGARMLSRSVDCGVGESIIAGPLGRIQSGHPNVRIGSYPQMGRLPVYTQLVMRSTDPDALDRAAAEVKAMVDAMHAEKNIRLPEEAER